jgi:hypothetical protein
MERSSDAADGLIVVISVSGSSSTDEPAGMQESKHHDRYNPPYHRRGFVCIPAQDFDAMTTFYGKTLGLPFVKRYGSRPGAEYQAGNVTLPSCAPKTSAGPPTSRM